MPNNKVLSEGVQLRQRFFFVLMRGGEGSNTTISAEDGPTLNAGLIAL